MCWRNWKSFKLFKFIPSPPAKELKSPEEKKFIFLFNAEIKFKLPPVVKKETEFPWSKIWSWEIKIPRPVESSKVFPCEEIETPFDPEISVNPLFPFIVTSFPEKVAPPFPLKIGKFPFFDWKFKFALFDIAIFPVNVEIIIFPLKSVVYNEIPYLFVKNWPSEEDLLKIEPEKLKKLLLLLYVNLLNFLNKN